MGITYPKAIMSRTELEELGIPRTLLERAYADPKQTFAQKLNPLKKHSKIIFMTDGFEEWRQKQADIERRGRR